MGKGAEDYADAMGYWDDFDNRLLELSIDDPIIHKFLYLGAAQYISREKLLTEMVLKLVEERNYFKEQVLKYERERPPPILIIQKEKEDD